MPPEGKSYNRNHIILLALIYNLKPILTIRDIKKLLLLILEMADDDSQANKIESMYSTYFALKESYLDEFINLIEHDLKIMDEKLNEEYNGEWQKIPKILLVLMLITQANIRKKISRAYNRIVL